MSAAVAASVEEHYQFNEVVGKGSFSVVRMGVKRTSRELVAIKCIDKTSLNTAEELAIPQREIRALRRLPRHPNAVFLLDSYETDSHVFLVFELARKGTLADWLHRQPLGLSELEAKQVVGQLALAIDHVHSHGIVHVDVTPRNVFIDDGGVVKLGDFGFAVSDARDMAGMRGSMNYASPELRCGEQFDEATDVWSLGVLTYETLTGVAPFSGGQEELRMPDSLWADKSPEARAFVACLLTRDKALRPTMKQVLKLGWLL